ncbi:MAG: biotin/lipoyl-containing protein, partial [Candidatus Thorarchaeota archaeon]
GGIVQAPMPGVILKVLVEPGDAVAVNDPVLVLEAMKMENEIKAPVAGTVEKIFVSEGGSVNTGDDLFRIQP